MAATLHESALSLFAQKAQTHNNNDFMDAFIDCMQCMLQSACLLTAVKQGLSAKFGVANH